MSSFIQKATFVGVSGSLSAVTAGNSIVAVVSWPNVSTTAINNNAGMTPALSYIDSTNGCALGIFYLNNAAAGAFNVSFTSTNYTNTTLLELYEVVPLAASPVLATNSWINSGTVDPDSFNASLATQSVASVQFSAYGRTTGASNNITGSMPAPWTIDGSVFDGATSYSYAAAASADVAANTAPNATWTLTGSPTGAVEDFATVAFSLAGGAGTNALSGTSQELAAASGGLTVAIPLGAASAQSAAGSGALTVAVPLAAAAMQAQSATGLLNVAVPLSGTASATQNADGSITVSVPLSAQAVQQAAAAASLGVTAPLAGAAGQVQAGSGNLTLSVALAGVGIQQQTASGLLTNTASGQVALSGASGADASAAAQLSIGAPLAGASLQLVGASGALAVQVPLSGVSAQSAQGSGSLSIAVQLSAQALQQAMASASLTNQAVVRINLTGVSLQSMQSLGTLQVFDLSKPSRLQNTFQRSQSLRDFIHPGGDRSFYRTATPRVFPRIPNARTFQRSAT